MLSNKEILLQWRGYLEDFSNPVKTTSSDICDTIDFGKEEVFTLTEVVAAI